MIYSYLYRLVLLVGLLLSSGQAVAQLTHSAAEPHESDSSEWRIGEQMRRESIKMFHESPLTPDQRLELWRSERSAVTLPTPQSVIQHFTWEFLGPKNQSGRITTLIEIPGSHQLIAGAAGGGIWRMQADSTWVALTDSFPSLQMTSSAIAPTNSHIMAMGTADGFVYNSTDFGQTWSVAQKSPGVNVVSLRYDPKNENTLYAATDDGLFVTVNGGLSWRKVSAGRARSIQIDPISGAIYFGQMDYGWPYSHESIMKSIDGGKNFNRMITLSEGYWSDVLFGMCTSQPNILYLGSDSSHTYFRSSDAGQSWQQVASSPYADSYNNGFWCFFVDPSDPNIAFAGGPALFRTSDGGASWSRVDANVHADFHTIAFGSGTAAALGCDGGIYVTTNYRTPAPVWTYASKDLVTLQAYNVAASPSEEDTVITGNQDNGYAKYSGTPRNWKIVGGDGFVTIYDPSDPAIFYHEYTNMNLHRATDGFTWWSTKVMNGLPAGSNFYDGIVGAPVDWYGQGIAIDPASPTVLYCGTDSLWKTTDRGDNWSKAAHRSFTRGGYVTAIAVSPVNHDRIYVGSVDGLVTVSTNGGGSWDTVAQSQFGKQLGTIYSIAPDPVSADVAYLTMQSSGATSQVFRTSDAGLSWRSIGNGLPPSRVSRIVVDPVDPRNLYVGTITGVYSSSNSGAQWARLEGFPTVQVLDLAWQTIGATQKRYLLVGTYGRGIIRGSVQSLIDKTDAVDLGSVRLGKRVDTTFLLLRNLGVDHLDVTRLLINAQDSAAFDLVNGTGPFQLSPGSAYSADIRFSPSSRRAYSAEVDMIGPDGVLQRLTTLSARGSIPTLSAPGVVALGVIGVSSTKDTSVQLSATGFASRPDTLTILTASVVGGSTGWLALANDSIPATITASRPFALKLHAMPASEGQLSAQVVLTTNGIPSSDTIEVSANATSSGVAVAFSDATISLAVAPTVVTNQATVRMNSPLKLVGSPFQLAVVDVGGRVLETLDRGYLTRNAEARLDASTLPSGTYFVRLTIGGTTLRDRMTDARFIVTH